MKSKIFAVATFAFAAAFAFTAAAATTALPMGGVTVKAGSPSAYVMGLQSNLNNCALANPALVADGKYGAKTTAAVAAFQVANGGLTVDGQAGPKTQAALIAKCAGSTTPTTPGSTTLSGGAGDATITATSTDVKNSLKEDESSVKVLGFQVEADGSDINVSNVKVILQNDNYAVSSEKLSNYVDSVAVYMGSTKVGSEDASDFSRDSGSPDTFTKTIALSNAVVKDGKKVKFYVAVSAVSNIDSDDLDADWNVLLDTVRYNDATGAILSDSPSLDHNFTFEDVSTDDSLAIKSSSSTPDATNLIVDANATSDEYTVGAFKLDVDDNSSDIMVTEIPVTVNFSNLDTNNSGTVTGADDSSSDTAAENVIDSLTVKVDGTDYDATLDSGSVSITDGSGEATYIVDLSSDDVTINSGDTVDVKISATFRDQDGNFNSGAVVSAYVNADDISAEADSELTNSQKTGAFSGEDQTLLVTGAGVSFSSGSFTAENVTDSIDGTIKLTFKVEAIGDDVVLADDGSDLSYAVTGATETDASLTCAGLTAQGGDYTITEGSTKTCTLSAKFNTTTGFVRLTITDVAGTAVSNIKTEDY